MTGTRAIALALVWLAACGDDGGGGGGDGGNGDGDAGVPDGGVDAEPDCVFTPTGEFNPAVECRWDGPATGVAYQAYDDVVMTPVVINLTDDDADGDVDTDDIPDIAFTTYRLQEDGCCNQNGVLRVVSGACDASGVLVEHFSIGATEIGRASCRDGGGGSGG